MANKIHVIDSPAFDPLAMLQSEAKLLTMHYFLMTRRKLECTKKLLEHVPVVGLLAGLFPMLIVISSQALLVYLVFALKYIFDASFSISPCSKNNRADRWSSDEVHVHVWFMSFEDPMKQWCSIAFSLSQGSSLPA